MAAAQTETNPDRIYETIATIFAVTVLIDKVRHERELIEFAHACCFHNRLIRPTRINPREAVIAWFETQSPKIEAKLSSRTRQDYITSLLRQVSDPALQRTVLSSIFAICIADSELHPDEEALINMVKATWQITLPSPDQVAAVVE